MSANSPQPHTWSVQTSLETSADGVVLVVRGRLGSAGTTELKEALAAASVTGRRLLLDLEHVDYISSAGLAVLHEAAGRLHESGGRLELARASESVRLALRLAGPIPHFGHAADSGLQPLQDAKPEA